jgi:hypothetical protein
VAFDMRKGSAMVLIQLLLPIRVPGSPTSDTLDALAQTRRELEDRFDGLTAYVRSPAQGSWTAANGEVEQDDVVMVEVVTDRFDRAWWRTYAAALARRFRQGAIHVRALPIDLLDDDTR